MTRTPSCLLIALTVVLLPDLVAQAQLTQLTVDRPVNDVADVLRQEDEERLSAFLIEHRRATGVQVGIVVVDSTGGQPIEDLAIETSERWMGGDAATDAGVLLLLVTGDGRARIEVGSGLEAVLTDSEVRLMLEEARPLLEEGAWSEALLELVWALSDETAPFETWGRVFEPAGDDGHHIGWWVSIGLAALTVILLGLWGWHRKWRGR